MTIEIKPNWEKAPAWANYWAVDINGSAFWYAKEPEPELDDEGKEYGVWIGDKNPAEDDYWVQNWKETLCKRPEQAETPETQPKPSDPSFANAANLELLLNEFREFKRLLGFELSGYNERLNKLERPNYYAEELDDYVKDLLKRFLHSKQ